MSLLAAPRRKQVISLNPQNKNDSNDWKQFGKGLMERFGWKDGDGLGAERQGETDFLNMAFKDDKRGVGCSIQYEQNWLSHSDAFNSLLSALNQNYGTTPAVEKIDHVAEGEANVEAVSLEKKSKSLKGRIHYHKFAKGKDLSTRTSEDISSVLGGRPGARKRKPSPESKIPGDKREDTPDAPSQDTAGSVTGLNTITSSDNIHDYFKKKFASKKKVTTGARDVTSPEEHEPLAVVTHMESGEVTDHLLGTNLQGHSLKESKRLKKKRRQSERETLVATGNEEAALHEPEDASSPSAEDIHVIGSAGDLLIGDLDAVTGNGLQKSKKKSRLKKRQTEDAADNDVTIAELISSESGNHPTSVEEELHAKEASGAPVEVTGVHIDIQTVSAVKRSKKRSRAGKDQILGTSTSAEVVPPEPVNPPSVLDQKVTVEAVGCVAERQGGTVEMKETTTVQSMVFRPGYSISMRSIQGHFRSLPAETKLKIFPGSNAFDIVGYGDELFH